MTVLRYQLGTAIFEFQYPDMYKAELKRTSVWFEEDTLIEMGAVSLDQSEQECHCGKNGHPLGSINCPIHGYKTISTPKIDASEECPHCHMSKSIRNPSGYCDHLHYPENCEVCKKAPESEGNLDTIALYAYDCDDELPPVRQVERYLKALGEHVNQLTQAVNDQEKRLRKMEKSYNQHYN